MALLKLCRCGKRIPQGQRLCDKCLYAHKQKRKKQAKAYDKKRNWAWFYNSPGWGTARIQPWDRDNGVCLMCFFSKDRLRTAHVVHHIIELDDDFGRAYDTNNLICLCERCHKRVHKKYREGRKKETQKELFEILRSQGGDVKKMEEYPKPLVPGK